MGKLKKLILTLAIFFLIAGLARLAMSDLNGWGVRWLIAGVLFIVHGAATLQKKAPPLATVTATALLVLTSLACQTSILGVDVGFATPTSTLVPVATRTLAPGASPSPTLPATLSASGRVCFKSLAGGNLRVRECPGLSCGEIDVIENDTLVQVTGERRDVDGTTWLRITAPVNGWVSSKFICNEGR